MANRYGRCLGTARAGQRNEDGSSLRGEVAGQAFGELVSFEPRRVIASDVPGAGKQVVHAFLDVDDASIDRSEDGEQELSRGGELPVGAPRHAKATAPDVFAQRRPASPKLIDEVRVPFRVRDTPVAERQARVAALFVGDLVLIHDQRPPGLPSRGGGGARTGAALPSMLSSIAFSCRASCTVSEYM